MFGVRSADAARLLRLTMRTTELTLAEREGYNGAGGGGVTGSGKAKRRRVDAPEVAFAPLLLMLESLQSLANEVAANESQMVRVVETMHQAALLSPHHVGLWNLLTLLEGGSQHGMSQALRRMAIRHLHNNMHAAPLIMYVANTCMERPSVRFALGLYAEAYRLHPNAPLISLCIGVCLLSQVMSRATSNRHRDLYRAFAFLINYRKLRAAQHAQEHASSGGSGIGTAASSAAIPATATSGTADGGAASGVGGGAHASSGSAIRTDTGDAVVTDAWVLPPVLPARVIERETLYNLGRACHQLNITHMAMHLYQACLDVKLPEGALAHVDATHSLSTSQVVFERVLNVQREAAYNYALLLRKAGEQRKAMEITLQYLSY